MSYLEYYLRKAHDGSSILLIGEGFMSLSVRVNEGALFIRNHNSESLKSVAVNEVVFFGPTPDNVKLLASERTKSMRHPRITTHYSKSYNEEYTP